MAVAQAWSEVRVLYRREEGGETDVFQWPEVIREYRTLP